MKYWLITLLSLSTLALSAQSIERASLIISPQTSVNGSFAVGDSVQTELSFVVHDILLLDKIVVAKALDSALVNFSIIDTFNVKSPVSSSVSFFGPRLKLEIEQTLFSDSLCYRLVAFDTSLAPVDTTIIRF